MGFNVLDTLSKLATESGFAGFFAAGGWQNLVMIVVACVLLYLGIVKGFEPLLLVGIAFGCLLANVSYFPGLDAINPDLNATNALYHPPRKIPAPLTLLPPKTPRRLWAK